MTLNSVDVSSLDPVSRSGLGDDPRLDWLAVEDLRIDDDYQRPLGKSNWRAIQNIARAFDWSMFTPILAAPLMGGAYALIDGQHRVHAAALIGLRRVPAMIVDVPPALQAASFAAVNSQRVAMTPFHVFKAELAAGDRLAMACARAVEDAGCRLMTYNASFKTRKPRDIYAISEIKGHIRSGRDRMITRALAAITGSDSADRVEMYRHKVLRAWFATFIAEPEFLELDLERFVGANDLSNIVDRVGNMRDTPQFAKFSDFALATKSFRALIRQSAKAGQIGAAA